MVLVPGYIYISRFMAISAAIAGAWIACGGGGGVVTRLDVVTYLVPVYITRCHNEAYTV